MALAIQTIATGTQSFGGGYTATPVNTYEYLGPMAGRTYRVTVLAPTGGGSSNMGASWNANDCSYGCDAWYTGPSHDFAMTANAAVSTLFYLIGRNNGGGPLGFTDYTIQDTGSDGGIPVVQMAIGAANGTVTIATPTLHNTLVAWVTGWTHAGTAPVFNAPSGWTAVGAQITQGSGGLATGRMFYRVADTSETGFTASGTGITSAETVEVVEYGLANGSLASAVGDTTKPNPVAGTFPSGCDLAVHAVASANGAVPVRRRADDPGPWLMDYYPTINQARPAWIAHVAGPSAGAWDWINTGVSGGDSWITQTAYFGTAAPPPPTNTGIRGIIG